MNKALIHTAGGYIGAAWTKSGLAVLNLPLADVVEAQTKLDDAVSNLKVKSPGNNPEQVLDFLDLESRLKKYFQGERVELSFPIDWSYYTDFQRQVLQRVYLVPWGQLASYGQVAREIGSPRGSRAVGGAVGANQVLLVIPCHRIIAGDGTLGGFGSGLDWKRKLLCLEGHGNYK